MLKGFFVDPPTMVGSPFGFPSEVFLVAGAVSFTIGKSLAGVRTGVRIFRVKGSSGSKRV